MKNLHIEHVEDLVFSNEFDGIDAALNLLKSMHYYLLDRSAVDLRVSEKIDGSPAIVAGTCPVTKKFFVGTKAVFNKTPKINFSVDDIEKNHGATPQLAEILKIAFLVLETIELPGIYQGDVLYTQRDLSVQPMVDYDMILFKPNLITYGIPTDCIEIADHVMDSEIGIAWHTQYTGSTWNNLYAELLPAIDFEKNELIYHFSTAFLDRANRSVPPSDLLQYQLGLFSVVEQTIKLIDKRVLKEFNSMSILPDLFQIYRNHRIRTNRVEKDLEDSSETVRGFLAFLQHRKAVEVGQLKTAPAKERKARTYDEWIAWVYTNNYQFSVILQAYYMFESIKNIQLRILNRATPELLGYIETNEGYKSMREGFVVQDYDLDRMIKFVNRHEFSRMNFLARESAKELVLN